ncbi:MAG: hypothetical protein V3U76_01870 [Granulosicoccus sp.]
MICLLFLPTSSLLAADAGESENTIDSGVVETDQSPTERAVRAFKNVGVYVDDAQQRASRNFNDFVLQVDDFFGSSSSSAIDNKSWARIRLDLSKPGDEKVKLGGTVKLRIVLPRTEKRFRLLLSTEDEDSTVSDADIAQPARVANKSDQSVSLALRFIRTARDNASLNFDLGVRQRDGAVQTFGRINGTIEGEQGEWYGRFSNNYYYYSKSGFQNKIQVEARRTLLGKPSLFFRSSTGFEWIKGSKGASISETLGVYAEISPRKAVAVEALAGYATALNGDSGSRYRGTELRFRWRHSVWRPWFFYEVWPSVSWPASNGYDRAYGGLFRVEFIIGQP